VDFLLRPAAEDDGDVQFDKLWTLSTLQSRSKATRDLPFSLPRSRISGLLTLGQSLLTSLPPKRDQRRGITPVHHLKATYSFT